MAALELSDTETENNSHKDMVITSLKEKIKILEEKYRLLEEKVDILWKTKAKSEEKGKGKQHTPFPPLPPQAPIPIGTGTGTSGTANSTAADRPNKNKPKSVDGTTGKSKNAEIRAVEDRKIAKIKKQTVTDVNVNVSASQDDEVFSEVKEVNPQAKEISKNPRNSTSFPAKKQNNEEAQWILASGKRRNRNKNNITQENRPKPLLGTRELANGLRMAEKKAFVFLSGFAPEVEAEAIKNYLKSNNMGMGCECEKMKTRSSKKSSFKLEVPFDKKNDYLDTSLWPRGAIVNHFLNIQRRVQGGVQWNRLNRELPAPPRLSSK